METYPAGWHLVAGVDVVGTGYMSVDKEKASAIFNAKIYQSNQIIGYTLCTRMTGDGWIYNKKKVLLEFLLYF